MSPLIQLARPRTLPLAFAVICCGNALAYHDGSWHPLVFILALLTALSLQILSNIANDYGDGIRGTDRARPASAPRRLTANGSVSPAYMRRLLVVCTLASLALGITLLSVSALDWRGFLVFLGLGALAITAAITYTVGRCAYGYHALGEISVFTFFGLLGVLGSYYLQSGGWHPTLLLPAAGSGLLAAAVLNINNIRDITSDRSAGKQTLAVKLGFERAKTLQYTLLVAASCCYLTYALLSQAYTSLLWLLLLPLVSTHARALHRAADQKSAGCELKRIVSCVCGVNLLFSLGLCL